MTHPDPLALVVTGPPGSGKSTLGRELARLLRAALLDQDVLTQPLTALIAELTGAGGDLDHPAMTGPVRRARYDTVLDVAADNLRSGGPVVLVAPFTRELADPAAWAELTARLAPAPVVLIRVRVPAQVLLSRRASRALPRDLAAAGRIGGGTAAAADVGSVLDLIADGQADPAVEAARIVTLLGSVVHRLRDPIETRESVDRP